MKSSTPKGDSNLMVMLLQGNCLRWEGIHRWRDSWSWSLHANVKGKYRVSFITLRDVAKGKELLWDWASNEIVLTGFIGDQSLHGLRAYYLSETDRQHCWFEVNSLSEKDCLNCVFCSWSTGQGYCRQGSEDSRWILCRFYVYSDPKMVQKNLEF